MMNGTISQRHRYGIKIVHGYGNIGFNFSPKSEEFFGFPMLKDNDGIMNYEYRMERKYGRQNDKSVINVGIESIGKLNGATEWKES